MSPSSLANDYCLVPALNNSPGAMLRLGGYSDQEEAAVCAGTPQTFYPGAHIQAEGSNALANAAGADSDTAGLYGLLLACTGRILFRAGERAYLQSVGDAIVQSGGAMALNANGNSSVVAGDTISITSGTNKDIDITAGDGEVTQTVRDSRKKVIGTYYSKSTDNTYKYTDANSYSYKVGFDSSTSLGASYSETHGVDVGFNLSLTMKIVVNIQFDLAATWICYRQWSAFIAQIYIEGKNGDLEVTTLDVKTKGACAQLGAAAVKAKTTSTITNAATSTTKTIGIKSRLMKLYKGGADAQIETKVSV